MEEKTKKELRSIIISISLIVIIGIALEIIFRFFTSYVLPSSIIDYLRKYNITHYLYYAIDAFIIFGIAHEINRFSRFEIELVSNRSKRVNLKNLYTIIRAIVYSVAIVIFLLDIGVSLTGAVLGGTVGGLVISFALQNTISNLLSGLMLSSSGIMKPGDPMYIFSWLFDNPVLGKIEDVKVLTTQVSSIDGLKIELPSTALLGQTQFTNLTDPENRFRARYHVTLTLPVDVPYSDIIQKAVPILETKGKELDFIVKEITLFQKNFNSNQVKVIISIGNIMNYNKCSDAINVAFDKAYWEAKNEIASKTNQNKN
ncbi:mechanosensitive ion channel domain-containing protein [Caldiplasma sukawensis]